MGVGGRDHAIILNGLTLLFRNQWLLKIENKAFETSIQYNSGLALLNRGQLGVLQFLWGPFGFVMHMIPPVLYLALSNISGWKNCRARSAKVVSPTIMRLTMVKAEHLLLWSSHIIPQSSVLSGWWEKLRTRAQDKGSFHGHEVDPNFVPESHATAHS